jgi:hypothetical protein
VGWVVTLTLLVAGCGFGAQAAARTKGDCAEFAGVAKTISGFTRKRGVEAVADDISLDVPAIHALFDERLRRSFFRLPDSRDPASLARLRELRRCG